MIKQFWILLGNIADMLVTFPPYGSDSVSQNEAFVKFYLKNIIRIQSSFLNHTLISLLAEIGGYVGLLLVDLYNIFLLVKDDQQFDCP